MAVVATAQYHNSILLSTISRLNRQICIFNKTCSSLADPTDKSVAMKAVPCPQNGGSHKTCPLYFSPNS